MIEEMDRKGGRGQCPKCGEWHNNVSFHAAYCEHPFPIGHKNQMRRDSDWGKLNNQVVGAENI